MRTVRRANGHPAMAIRSNRSHQHIEYALLQRYIAVSTRQRCDCMYLTFSIQFSPIGIHFFAFFGQGGIIGNQLRKEQVAEHAVKIREQYDILERYLTAHKFMATNYVRAVLITNEEKTT